MRLTVGPLPPAVYWRRRVIVLGAFLATLALLLYSCGGSDPSGAASSAKPSGSTAGSAAALLTPFVDGSPGPSTAASAAPTPLAGAQPTGSCADGEITVTIATDNGKTDFLTGEFVRISLKIKNISGRTCVRDVGAAAQELRIAQGAQKLWSSDDCASGPTPGADLHTFQPGDQLDQFYVVWNGRASTNCQTRPVATPGAYQILGRFGTRWSDPLGITIKAR